MSCRLSAHRSPDALPQTTTENLFTVAGGMVRIRGILGRVTTDISSMSGSCVLKIDPTMVGAGTYTFLSASLGGVGAGSLIGGDGVAGAVGHMNHDAVVLDGFIQLQTTESVAGAIEWWIDYEPLDLGAVVVAV